MSILAMSDPVKPTIGERYSTAVHASNLSVEERTKRSDSDVLGAYAIASKVLTEGKRRTGKREEDVEHVKPAPLAVPLERLFAGDSRAASEIVAILSEMAYEKSWSLRIKIARVQCDDMAKACLAWHRNGRCDPCGGTGYELVQGTGKGRVGGVLSDRTCEHCGGNGKLPFDTEWSSDAHVPLARWLVNEMERAMGQAGPAAMRALAPRLEL